MVKNSFLIIIAFLFLQSFDVVNKLASPFYYEDYENRYQNYEKSYNIASKISNTVLIVSGIFFLIFFPSRRYSRRYGSQQASIEALNRIDTFGSALAETAVKIFATTQQKKYFRFTENDIISKQNEIKDMLIKNGIDPQDIINFAISSINEFFKYLSNKKNRFSEVSTLPLYKRFLDKNSSLLPIGYNYEIKNIYLVNFRYSIYEKAFSVYIKYKIIESQKDGGLFITFVEDNGFKISLIERESESYIMKMENFFTDDNKFSLFNKDKLKKINPELQIAETFYEIYMWWKGEGTLKKERFINEKLYNKLLEAKNSLKSENTYFNIIKIKLSNVEILHIKENFSELSLKIIARIVFEICGSFRKNNTSLIENEEKKADEIWEFEIKQDKLFIHEIIKKDSNIEPNPLQIEWHI